MMELSITWEGREGSEKKEIQDNNRGVETFLCTAVL